MNVGPPSSFAISRLMTLNAYGLDGCAAAPAAEALATDRLSGDHHPMTTRSGFEDGGVTEVDAYLDGASPWAG